MSPKPNHFESFVTRRFVPRRYRPGGLGNWSGHLSFANDLIAALRPHLLVELGTHYGESYFGFCQAVEENAVPCKCFAVDAWQGDFHSGSYDEAVFSEVNQHNLENYANFSVLLRSTFDDAIPQFSDASIDLLHLDGLHTYDAVKHDFFSWLPKLRQGGVVLLHDTMARHADFGVWRLWEELSREFSHFEFFHSWGLGVLRVAGGAEALGMVKILFEGDPDQQAFLRRHYEIQGENLELRYRAELPSIASSGARLTVYPCLQEGYAESTASSVELRPGIWDRRTVILPRGSNAGSIRLDPADRVCIVEIKQIAVCRAADATKLAEWAGPDMAELRAAGDLMLISHGSSTRYFSTGPDPQLYLPPIPPNVVDQPLLIEVWIRTLFDLRWLEPPLVPIAPGARQMDSALKEKSLQLEEMMRQHDSAQSQVRLLQAELTEARAEVRCHQAERLALLADHRRNQATLEGRLRDMEYKELHVKSELEHQIRADQEARLELQSRFEYERDQLQSRFEYERDNRIDLLNSYSWRVTGPLRRLYEICNRIRRPRL